MEITLDITKRFRYIVNYALFFDCDIPMNPIIFFNNPFQFNKNFSFELMNFGLNIEDKAEHEFSLNSPYFDDVLKCEFLYKSIIIIGRAKFHISNLKGLGVQLTDYIAPHGVPADTHYYEHACKINKGDFIVDCGGKSEFSHHFIKTIFIADKDAKITVTFSASDYLLKSSDDHNHESHLAKKQTPYNFSTGAPRPDILEKCTAKKPEMFDNNYRAIYFGDDDVAIRDEV